MKHWTEPKGADKELIEAIGAVTDPLEALECVSYMASYIGADPYYRDFNRAVWAMVARVTGAHESGATPPPPPAHSHPIEPLALSIEKGPTRPRVSPLSDRS